MRLVLTGSVILLLASALEPAQPPYPAARRSVVVDDYFGTRVADPYRWLEQLDSSDTLEWVTAERRLTREYLARIPARETIERRLKSLWSFSRTEVPWQEARRIFFTENSGLQPQPLLYEQRTVDEAPRVVLDPGELSADGSVAVGDYAVSPDGRWLAYSVSRGGADTGETRVRELASGHDLDDVIRGTWGTACWTVDGRGFFYMRTPPAGPDQAGAAPRVEKRLLYHKLGQPQADDRLIHEWKDNYRWLYSMLSDDGRRAIIVAERGSTARMYTLELGNPATPAVSVPLVPLLAGREAKLTPMGTVGDTLYAVTDLEAPRGRIIALDLRNGARAEPHTIVGETQEVIQGASVAGDRLAVHYLDDVRSRLRLFTLNGQPAGEIALPGIGAVGWALNGRHSVPELWYSFTSFLVPSTVYRYDMRTGASRAFRAPRVPFDPADYETTQIVYESRDGTRVPMFITARRNLQLDSTNPVLLTGYGGYGIVTGPSYRPDLPFWLELGGVYAVANIRGGGELGEEWHRAGSGHHKQNSFDDFIAAAEHLISHRYTAPDKLAMYGYSNGGLLVGAVLTQRPDLFAVALPDAGHHDMLRFHRFTVGSGWIPEYGSPDDPADFPFLLAYSPLHHVRTGTCYPATLVLTADHDDRVVPSHSYKLTAALQAAQGCDRPILLHVTTDASHSYATAGAAIAELADLWTFTTARLDVPVPPGR